VETRRNDVDSKRKAWTTPVLRALYRSDQRILRAASENPDFAAALRRHQDAESEARPLVV